MYLVSKEMGARRERTTSRADGAAGWILEWVSALRLGVTMRMKAKKRMNVVESLSLGGKKQLLLVQCSGERFLVGTGGDSVQTILRIHTEVEAAKQPHGRMLRDLL